MPEDFKNFLNDLLYTTAQQRASDLHLSPGHYPTIRVDGRLVVLNDKGILDPNKINGIISYTLQAKGLNRDTYLTEGEINFTYTLEQKARFRISAYKTKGFEAAVFRYIPEVIGTLEELGLPRPTAFFSRISQGLVLIASPNGHGKTTTAASLVNLINMERYEKIMTIEHPIEYVLDPEKSIIDQREIHLDTPSFEQALKYIWKKNINVLMIDRLDSIEKLEGVISVAEGGVLIIATVAAPASAQVLEKLIALAGSQKQGEMRLRLSNIVSGIIAQKLIPRIRGGVAPAVEIVIANPAVRGLIRERKLGQLNLVLDTSSDLGMVSLNRSLAELVNRNEISVQQAEFHSLNRNELKSLLR